MNIEDSQVYAYIYISLRCWQRLPFFEPSFFFFSLSLEYACISLRNIKIGSRYGISLDASLDLHRLNWMEWHDVYTKLNGLLTRSSIAFNMSASTKAKHIGWGFFNTFRYGQSRRKSCLMLSTARGVRERFNVGTMTESLAFPRSGCVFLVSFIALDVWPLISI